MFENGFRSSSGTLCSEATCWMAVSPPRSSSDRSVRARAVVFVAPRVVRVEPVDVGEPRDGQLLVRTEMSGISGGTELLAYRGEIDPDAVLDDALPTLTGTFRYPFSYGYSAVGTVERSNGDVSEGTVVFAFHPHQDRFVADADAVFPLEDISPRLGTLFPLVETGLQVALDADARIGEPVVVTGLGPIGILSGAILARTGADVLGSDPDPFRRDVAKRFGITSQRRPTRSAVFDTASSGASVVVEASGDRRPFARRSIASTRGNSGRGVLVRHEGEPAPPSGRRSTDGA